jgi:hypothetical protein
MPMLLIGCANETAELTEKTLTSNTNAKTKMFCLMPHQLEKIFKKRQRYARRKHYARVIALLRAFKQTRIIWYG